MEAAIVASNLTNVNFNTLILSLEMYECLMRVETCGLFLKFERYKCTI